MNSSKQYLLEQTGSVALMNSQRLWLPAQDQHKTKPVNSPARMGKGTMSRPPPAEDYLQLMAVGGESVFFWGAEVLPHFWWMASYEYMDSKNWTWWVIVFFKYIYLKRVEEELGGMEVNMIKIQCMCVWNYQRKLAPSPMYLGDILEDVSHIFLSLNLLPSNTHHLSLVGSGIKSDNIWIIHPYFITTEVGL